MVVVRCGRRGVRRLLLAGALGIGLVGVVPAPAGASYDWTGDLSASGGEALLAQVDSAPDGTATAVWMRHDGSHYRVQARRVSGTGTLGPVRTLSGGVQDGDQPAVAVADDGVATVVWQRSDGTDQRIQTRQVRADGSLSPVRTLSAAGQDAREPEVDVDDAGRATVVWTRSDGTTHRVQARRLAADGVPVAGPRTVSEAGLDVDQAQVAVDDAGHALVVWAPYERGAGRVRSARYSAEGVLGPVRFHSPAGAGALAPQVAIDGAGVATVVFSLSDGTHHRVTATRLGGPSDRGSWTLSGAGQSAWGAQVGVDSAGTATVVWYRSDGSSSRVESRRVTADGSVQPVRVVSPAAEEALVPQVGVDDAGLARVVWLQEEVGSAPDRILARTVPAKGSLPPAQVLSTIRDARRPQVAVSGGGVTTAVFEQHGGAHWSVVASRDLP